MCDVRSMFSANCVCNHTSATIRLQPYVCFQNRPSGWSQFVALYSSASSWYQKCGKKPTIKTICMETNGTPCIMRNICWVCCYKLNKKLHISALLHHHLWHVQVVDKDEKTFAGRGAVSVLCTLLHVRLQIALYVQRGGPVGEIHVHQKLRRKKTGHLENDKNKRKIHTFTRVTKSRMKITQ